MLTHLQQELRHGQRDDRFQHANVTCDKPDDRGQGDNADESFAVAVQRDDRQTVDALLCKGAQDLTQSTKGIHPNRRNTSILVANAQRNIHNAQ